MKKNYYGDWSDELTSRDESVKDNLSSVEEVSKLSLPDWQELGLGNAHAVLKPQYSLLRQGAVTHLHSTHTHKHIYFPLRWSKSR